jgi:hypothetical protein
MFALQVIWNGLLLGYVTRINGSVEYGERDAAVGFASPRAAELAARRILTAIDHACPSAGLALCVAPTAGRRAA